ncbi:DEAD/DEAH box helicase [Glycomyces sp. L485]|uniref:DEAD/DEAH box helicase n=1 Tax=Glycomyces sp. L485 TaxID=2909235 RepID=UPI001F4AADEB|nr:DEAD/DEAH box helicase [Glycomyces sp. L485]MCH7231534.1 DEAD/DEAH box helicase [Glycomyces sp. L485]
MVSSTGDMHYADDRSPAQRQAAAKARRTWPELAAFAGDYSFELDDFQIQACRILEDGHGVLVCAPTGAGKTVVGEFAVHLALAEGAKCFYTTPIKALSNQKFNDLTAVHGAENVGLLTGDTVINGEAPIVVMTTEVLRNMIYAGSPTLSGLRYVVMDEVHYLADRFRGAVWEEIIIELPQEVRVVSLSATVSNAEEFGDWLKSVRGSTEVVVSETRPVPLWQHMMVGGSLLDLFEPDGDYVSKELLKKDARARERSERHGGGRRRGRPHVERGRVVERLDGAGLLPAIYFIFSRAGCDAAVDECVRAGLQLTGGAERDEIIDYATAATAHIEARDLEAVGFERWLDGLAAGIAAHHAGLLPVFKGVVEKLFERGLLKAVFATETLALGINMPARSVVLERLIKYDGSDHVMLTPGQYTQLTGRAGRRGIDVEGHAVTIWAQDIRPKEVAGLASKRTYPLNSSFAPSYNMAVNLIGAAGVDRAQEVLASSFAQFQSDTEAVHIAEQARAVGRKAAESAEAAACDFGDFLEYYELTQRLAHAERGAQKRRKGARKDAARSTLGELRGGDVVWIARGKHAGWAVFLRPTSHRKAGHDPRWAVVTADGWTGSLDTSAFDGGVEVATRIRIPKHFNRKDPRERADLAASLREATRDARKPTRRGGAADTPEIAKLRDEVRAHPCRSCPDTHQHTVHASRWIRLHREEENLRRRAGRREHSLARQFTAVREVLTEFGYLEGEAVTDSGRLLRNIFCETDLLVAQCLRDGVWEGMDAPSLAAVASTVIYESRFEEDEFFVAVPGPINDAVAATGRRWEAIRRAENQRGLSLTSKPQLGLAWPMYRWARGEELSKALAASDGPWPMPGGDFVRWARRTADLLHQMGTAARVIGTRSSNALADEAFDAVDAIRRGVVADV